MSGAATRLSHILRVRGLEHRIAQMRLAEAERRLASITQIGVRIDVLRARTTAESGLTDGASLKAAGDMAVRLDKASADMAAPVAAAAADRDTCEIRCGLAWASEEGTRRLYQRAADNAALDAERRADANRPFGTKSSRFIRSKAAS